MKRSVALVVCAAVLAVAMASFAKQPKTEVPALVATARFVHVTTYYGTSPADGRISAQARAAVAQVEDAVRDWGRYQLTMNARDADIILLVRPAARASVMAGPTIGIGTDRRPQIGGTAGVEVSSSADDMLAVYSGTPGIDSAPLWRRTSANGFGSDMALFKAFKKAVEDSTAALKAPKKP